MNYYRQIFVAILGTMCLLSYPAFADDNADATSIGSFMQFKKKGQNPTPTAAPKPKKSVKVYTPPNKQVLAPKQPTPTPQPSPPPEPVVRNAVVEEEEEEEEEVRLTRSWFGYRSKLADYGLDFNYIYKGEVVKNTSGGIESGTSIL